MRRKHQTGFTLLELLVVMAVIGILAALLLMAISRAKARAQLIQCVNNVHQQGLGLEEFVTDNHYYPLSINPNYYKGAYPENGVNWEQAVTQAMGMKIFDTNNRPAFYKPLTGVFLCPAAVNWTVQIPGGQMFNLDYGYNADGLTGIGPQGSSDLDSLGLGGHKVAFNPRNHNSPAPPIHSFEVVNPSEMLAIGDGFSGSKSVILDSYPTLSRNRDWSASKNQQYLNYTQITKEVYARHQSRANMVFCDGHVETLTLKYLFQDTNDAALACWNRDHQPHRERLLP